MSAPAAQPDHYAVLGLPATATPRQITHAYRALMRALHPDTTTIPGDTRARLTAVTTAYQVLHDASRRAAYDRSRATPAPSPPAPPQTSSPLRVTVHAARPTDPTLIPASAHPATREPLLRAGPTRVSPLPPRTATPRSVEHSERAHPRPGPTVREAP